MTKYLGIYALVDNEKLVFKTHQQFKKFCDRYHSEKVIVFVSHGKPTKERLQQCYQLLDEATISFGRTALLFGYQSKENRVKPPTVRKTRKK